MGALWSSCASSWVSQLYVGPYLSSDSLEWSLPAECPAGCSAEDLAQLSDLRWNSLMTLGAQAGFQYSFLHPQLLLRGDGQIGAILSGQMDRINWRSGQLSQDLQQALSHSRGWTAIGQIMGGLKIAGQRVSWAPSIGLDGAIITLHQEGLAQLLELNFDRLRLLSNPRECLDLLDEDLFSQICPQLCQDGRLTAYHVKWGGPLAALTLWLAPLQSVSCELHGWYSLGRYSAEASWCWQDIYQKPREFYQHAHIHTWQAQISLMIQLARSLGLVLQAGARHTWANHGEETVEGGVAGPTCGIFEDLRWRRYWGTLALGIGF